MAEDHHYQTSGNWWDSAKNVRFESGSSQSSSSGVTNNMGNFGWQTAEMADMKPRCSVDSISPNSGSSSVIFHDASKKLPDSSTSSDPNLHMMGLGLSSHAMDWNQASLLRGEKAEENNFRSILQENLSSSSTDFQQETGMGLTQVQWREKLFSAENSSTNEFKQVNRSFSLDQTQFSPQYSSNDRLDSSGTSQGFPPSFQMDSSGPLYGNPSLLQGLIGSDNQAQQVAMNFPYQASDLMPSNWSKVPQFLRASPPKQLTHNQLQFTNNTPFWNASEAAIKDVRSSFFPSLQPPLSPPNFGAQTKNISQVRDPVSVVKKSGSEGAPKRPRNETTSSLPAFKVRKEKMGDRITALQQLVSPFGKTDTASVLSEAIEYIKFLHEQVTVLSTPYMKSGAPVQHQQSSGKSKEAEVPKQDLRSRGLCLVPVSSTYPVAHESTVDFWTPTFGGTTFR